MDRILPASRREGPRRQQPSAEYSDPRSTPRRRYNDRPASSSSNPPHSPYSNSQRTHNAPSDTTRRRQSAAREHFIAMTGEFVGTFMFLYFAEGATQVANVVGMKEQTTLIALFYIACAFGFSLATTAWVFYRVSGGLFNPAVTLGMCITGSLPWVRGLLLFPCQLLGGMVAAALVKCMFPGPMTTETLLTSDTTPAQGVFIEMFLTAELVLTVLFIAVEKQKATFVAPVAIGLALFVAELLGLYFTGGSLNPARSLGPAVANRHFPTFHWIYWIGPFLGAIIAGGYYKFAKVMEYEDANPGQDDTGEDVERKESLSRERRGIP